MRKKVAFLLAVMMAFSLPACQDKDSEMPKDRFTEQTEEREAVFTNNVLIVYFSRWGNTDYTDDVDATTSASIVIDDNVRYGTTEYVANMIAEQVGGDLHQIETVIPYTADFDELRDVNHFGGI